MSNVVSDWCFFVVERKQSGHECVKMLVCLQKGNEVVHCVELCFHNGCNVFFEDEEKDELVVYPILVCVFSKWIDI